MALVWFAILPGQIIHRRERLGREKQLAALSANPSRNVPEYVKLTIPLMNVFNSTLVNWAIAEWTFVRITVF